ncbi:hypothetical protein HYP97_gp58 [Klebsiella phage KpCHEMY26]|uniref:Uncharacterized protein n=1 Tax=Klebsiella phage KpCHEMY26 TaxID=2596966 RepID=A0A5B8R5U7_9CAUD|nr:hypothetical protein HYP97_gp58 [Klebsiella phage KpCHEMY26]QEA03331.1 hypothetical protein [Klebsiella phage KpCHEMY26]
MQITLNQDEILEALKDYAFRVINVAPGNDITIDLKAGRGENGYSATLDIVPQKLTESHVPTQAINRTEKSEGSVGLRTEVIERTVEPRHGIMRAEAVEAPAELPVVGEDVIDTKPEEEPQTPDDADPDVDAYLEGQKTRSLFARN